MTETSHLEATKVTNLTPLQSKRVLVTGGTGSLGKTLVRRLLAGELGEPSKIIIFSRDETKQHQMRVSYMGHHAAKDDVICRKAAKLLEYRIGDVRDYHSVNAVLGTVYVVFNAAALKQVPACEYFPFEAVQTNIVGPENIVRAMRADLQRRVGPWREDIPGIEDTEISCRIRAAGARVRYEPAMRVLHHIPRRRFVACGFIRQNYAWGMHVHAIEPVRLTPLPYLRWISKRTFQELLMTSINLAGGRTMDALRHACAVAGCLGTFRSVLNGKARPQLEGPGHD